MQTQYGPPGLTLDSGRASSAAEGLAALLAEPSGKLSAQNAATMRGRSFDSVALQYLNGVDASERNPQAEKAWIGERSNSLKVAGNIDRPPEAQWFPRTDVGNLANSQNPFQLRADRNAQQTPLRQPQGEQRDWQSPLNPMQPTSDQIGSSEPSEPLAPTSTTSTEEEDASSQADVLAASTGVMIAKVQTAEQPPDSTTNTATLTPAAGELIEIKEAAEQPVLAVSGTAASATQTPLKSEAVSLTAGNQDLNELSAHLQTKPGGEPVAVEPGYASNWVEAGMSALLQASANTSAGTAASTSGTASGMLPHAFMPGLALKGSNPGQSQLGQDGQQRGSERFETPSSAPSDSLSANPASGYQQVWSGANPGRFESLTNTQGNFSADRVVQTTTATLQSLLAEDVKQAEFGDRQVRLELHPKELGILTISIKQDASGVSASIQASTEAAADLLKQHASSLQQAAQSVGVTLQKLSVSLANDSGRGNPDAQANERSAPGRDATPWRRDGAGVRALNRGGTLELGRMLDLRL